MRIPTVIHRSATAITGLFAILAGGRLTVAGVRRHRAGERGRTVWARLAAGAVLMLVGLVVLVGLKRSGEASAG